jgi:xylulokinase
MVLRWFRDELGSGRDYDALVEEARAIPPGADGLVMLPHLSGAFCPEANPRAKGVFWGITLSHKRGHFVRAILEAVAFMLRENLEMLASLHVPIHELRSLGGAARSDLWLQIKADVCGQDLLVMDCTEATSLGAAMISFVGNGTYGTLQEARERMVRIRKRVEHSPEAADRYEAVYRRYRALYRRVAGAF